MTIADASTVAERIKLWVDNKLLIDQWTSLDVSRPTCTFAFPVAMDYYEIDLEFKTLQYVPGGGNDYTDADASTAPTVQLGYHVTGVTGSTNFKTVGSSYLARKPFSSSHPSPHTLRPSQTWERKTSDP